MANSSSESWVAAAAACLKRNGSWTGRIHIHKHLYLVKQLGLADPPFDFVLYQYGPYSYGLDSQIAQMELYGYMQKSFPQPGYGPQYSVSELGTEEAAALGAAERGALERVAKAIGGADSQQLELQATCLWVEREELVTDDAAILARVKKLKPKYSDEQIRDALDSARAFASSLAGAPERAGD